jgi:SAM-dependent methyltransferase
VRLPVRALDSSGVRPPARVLDAGAGRGGLVAALRARGYAAEGIDPSPRGENVHRAGMLEHTAADLDAVVMWHALEHVPDPAPALRRAAGWLRPRGVVLVAVPNLASLQARIAGGEWFHLDLPRHRTHFTTPGVRTIVERSGFEVVHVEHRLLEHNPFGLWQTLVNRFTPTPSWLFHALKRNAPLRAADAVPTALALPLAPVAAVVEAGAALAQRGGTVAVVARRVR